MPKYKVAQELQFLAEIFKQSPHISTTLKIHHWTYCEFKLSEARGGWKAIILIDDAFPGMHLIGSVN